MTNLNEVLAAPQVGAAAQVSELELVLSGIPWHESFKAGAGIDAVTGGVAGTAIEPFQAEGSGARSSEEELRYVRSQSDLEREIEQTTEGKYNIQQVSIDQSNKFLQKIKVSELAVTLICEYRVSHQGYDEAESYALTSEAKARLGQWEAFREAYGDYFIAGVKRESSFVAIYNCTASSSEKLNEFKASLGAQVSGLFSQEGSVRFKELATRHGIELSVSIRMNGYQGTPPETKANPAPEDVVQALNWFKAHEAGVPTRAKLKHYKTIAGDFPRTRDIAPDVFAELRLLYRYLWLARAKYGALPGRYRESLLPDYNELDAAVPASQARLAADQALRYACEGKLQSFIGRLNTVLERMDFYRQLGEAAAREPGRGVDIIEKKNQQHRWLYGFSSHPGSDAVVIHKLPLRYHEGSRPGWREQTLELGPDDGKLIVGWEVISNWTDGSNGRWSKASDTIVRSRHGAVHVKSAHLRGCDWTVNYYYVDAVDYQFD